MTEFEPLGDRILVKQTEAADKTSGGIVLPDQARQKPKEGIVVSIGPGKLLENGDRLPMSVAEGDYIVFSEHVGQPLSIDDEEHLIMSSEDVIGKVKTNG